MSKSSNDVKISKAKGRPMLTWVGKTALERATAYPAQLVERFAAEAPADSLAAPIGPTGRRSSTGAACSSMATTRTYWPTCSPTASAAR